MASVSQTGPAASAAVGRSQEMAAAEGEAGATVGPVVAGTAVGPALGTRLDTAPPHAASTAAAPPNPATSRSWRRDIWRVLTRWTNRSNSLWVTTSSSRASPVLPSLGERHRRGVVPRHRHLVTDGLPADDRGVAVLMPHDEATQ